MVSADSNFQRKQFPLKNQTILITGASRLNGIGCAAAKQAAALGATVVIQHFRPHDENMPWGADSLETVKQSIEAELVGEAALYDIHADFTDVKSAEEVMQYACEKAGTISGLVCNHASSAPDGSIGELNAAMLDHHWQVNARSVLLLTQAFAAQFPQSATNGRIIYLTSGQRSGPMPGEIAYSASKGALADLTLTIADQLADKQITVNTINPGPVDTGYLSESDKAQALSKFPFGRFGKPEDPARLIGWLLTDESRWITGQIIHSEGGFARWRP
ncbi:SDR family oxidoreductase [Salisediminibacterium halotolerans]|uniref:SDR family oxidoreductase n=1 Tax=Salisediminibacterium halotolerans TaxID=517425 RepID=UPI000EB4200A|nr:SDR family oxidoreductase [Salisediminibacterium halotolerans]RLJ78249.1 3-oxoacyl-[acyl-carrier protein] reductase [Actinophytocola xinjiangensis]RPE88412.1 3-oxoacyl-[acyl-carrier protein] reductase [Salisediminibacterium halotolerans]TWG37226.1 3-oxoacyl-[acyl-carrier protein] reductase [Salisediminibacterium halotolerans]GEL07160.1 3-ketoacyl-ACP reductase [Salisediminibacterium halotolerans]